MEHAGHTNAGTQPFWIASDGCHGLRQGFEQQTIDSPLVPKGDPRNICGKVEDHMEVLGRQRVFGTCRHPVACRRCLTFWAVPIFARVLGDMLMVALGAGGYIWRCTCSARERGANRDRLEEIIQQINDEFADPQFELGIKGPITDQKRLDVILKEVLKFEKGIPQDLPYELVKRMNEEWAVLMVDGKVEFQHRPSGVFYPLRDFSLRTKPMTCVVGGKTRQMSVVWSGDRDRLEYEGIVIDVPDYEGDGFNVSAGWLIEPKIGDASQWVDYVERIVCGGDKALAYWVMSYVADGVQRAWTLHPGTALALRGPQGGGKSFLGKMMRRIPKPAQVQEVADTDRLFERFNRGMFGSTFVLAEESLFAGNKRQANTLNRPAVPSERHPRGRPEYGIVQSRDQTVWSY